MLAAEPASSLSFYLALLRPSFLGGIYIVTIEVPEPDIAARLLRTLLIFQS
jgi:hypothetical protein